MPRGFRLRHLRSYRSRQLLAVLLCPALVVGAILAGCGGPQKGEGSGGECFRDADCKEGLVCVDGECSSDVDSLVSVVEGPDTGTMTAAVGAGGVTATAAATATSTTGGMTGAGGNSAMGAGGAVGASTTDAGTTDTGSTTGSGATGAGGASAATATATATETTGISGNAGAPSDP